MGDCLVSLTIFGFAYLSYSVCENLSSVSATHSMNALMDGNLEEYGEYIIKRQLYTFASQLFHAIYVATFVLVCYSFVEGFIIK